LIIAEPFDLVRHFIETPLPHDHSHQFFSGDAHSLRISVGNSGQRNRFRSAPLIRKWIEGKFIVGRWKLDSLPPKIFGVGCFLSHRDQRFRHWNLVNAVFGERNTNRIPDAIGQKRANPDRTLDSRVFAFAGLSHAEVDWIIPIRSFFVQTRHQQSISVDHYLRVARLHRKNEGVIIEITRDTGKFKRAFHHAERGIAITIHDSVAQRAVIRADPHRDAALFA
jgi:hypothetical protein